MSTLSHVHMLWIDSAVILMLAINSLKMKLVDFFCFAAVEQLSAELIGINCTNSYFID